MSRGSLAALADYGSIVTGGKDTTFAHNNSLHASVASGIILIRVISLTVYAAAHTARTKLQKGGLVVALGIVLVILALPNVNFLNSKDGCLAKAISF